MSNVSRPLIKVVEIEPFVKDILKITDEKEIRKAIQQIGDAERNCSFYIEHSTLHSIDYRDINYRSTEQRKKLCSRVLSELKNNVRLKNDDDINLGRGGARPPTNIQADSQLFYIVGLPASGKSGISNVIADYYGAYILDSDYAKRKLPEYCVNGGASLVHEESDEIIFNQKDDNLLRFCIENKYNMVIPKIGHNKNKVCKFCEKMNAIGYTVNLISIDLDRVAATKRAYHRFMESQRYVPLSLIFDTYSNQPSLNYFKIKQEVPPFISGYAQISTDVLLGENPILLEEKNLDSFNVIFPNRKLGGESNGKNAVYEGLI